MTLVGQGAFPALPLRSPALERASLRCSSISPGKWNSPSSARYRDEVFTTRSRRLSNPRLLTSRGSKRVRKGHKCLSKEAALERNWAIFQPRTCSYCSSLDRRRCFKAKLSSLQRWWVHRPATQTDRQCSVQQCITSSILDLLDTVPALTLILTFLPHEHTTFCLFLPLPCLRTLAFAFVAFATFCIGLLLATLQEHGHTHERRSHSPTAQNECHSRCQTCLGHKRDAVQMFVGSANVFLFSSSKNKKPETFLVRSELCNFSNRSDSSDVEPCSERVSGMSSDGRLTAGSISSSNSRLVFGQSVTGAVKMMEVTQATAAQARWLRPSAKGWAEAGPVAASSAQAFSLSSSWHVWAAAGLASKGCALFLGPFSEKLPQCQQCGHQAEFRSHENSTFGEPQCHCWAANAMVRTRESCKVPLRGCSDCECAGEHAGWLELDAF